MPIKAHRLERKQGVKAERRFLARLSSLQVADALIALSLWFAFSALVLWRAEEIGVGYDEPIYGGYAIKYLAWLNYLVESWSLGRFFDPFRPEIIDLYWHARDMHPPIPKLMAAIGYWLLTPILGSDFAGMRSGTAILFGAMLAAIYWFGREQLTRPGALFAAFAVAFMPRLFTDAHFLTMDMPVTATVTIGTLLLLRAVEQPNWKRIAAAVIGVGMAFSSKANGFLIIPAAAVYILVRNGFQFGGNYLKSQMKPLLKQVCVVALVAFGAMAFLFATWLWLWVDPINRFREYFTFHAKHFVVHTYYLGRLYPVMDENENIIIPTPWHYPFVMTLVTVPTMTLLLALVGMGLTVFRWRQSPPLTKMSLVSYFVQIAPFLLASTPKYNGIRLFEPAFPFLGILAGYVFGLSAKWLLEVLKERAKQLISEPRLVVGAIGLILLAPAAYETLTIHPFGLSYYNALVGGTKGAANRWGFEVTYWGVNLLSVIPFLNKLPEGTKVLVYPGAWCAYTDFYKNAGILRRDIEIMGNPKDLPKADYVVFQGSQTELAIAKLADPLFGELLWKLWKEAKPAYAAIHDGVVIVGVYDRETVKGIIEELKRRMSSRFIDKLSRYRSSSLLPAVFSPHKPSPCSVLFWTIVGFFSGSLPFSFWLGWLVARVDIRRYGDGNPGATNAWRVGGWRVGVPALLLDYLKGMMPVAIARFWNGVDGWGLVPVALAPVLGHAFSPFLRFQGGKAIASTFGIWGGLTFWVGPTVMGLTMTLAFAINKTDAWSAILGMVFLGVYLMLSNTTEPLLVVWAGNLAIVIWKHRYDLRTPPQFRPWLQRLLRR
ncbi:MAG: glycerol-3-phosphate acyltransferase [Armatimonadota bacterium]